MAGSPAHPMRAASANSFGEAGSPGTSPPPNKATAPKMVTSPTQGADLSRPAFCPPPPAVGPPPFVGTFEIINPPRGFHGMQAICVPVFGPFAVPAAGSVNSSRDPSPTAETTVEEKKVTVKNGLHIFNVDLHEKLGRPFEDCE